MQLEFGVRPQYGYGQAGLDAHAHVGSAHLYAEVLLGDEDLQRLEEVPRVVGAEVDGEVVRGAVELSRGLLLEDVPELAHDVDAVAVFDGEEDVVTDGLHAPLVGVGLGYFRPILIEHGLLVQALVEVLEHPSKERPLARGWVLPHAAIRPDGRGNILISNITARKAAVEVQPVAFVTSVVVPSAVKREYIAVIEAQGDFHRQLVMPRIEVRLIQLVHYREG